MSNCIGVFGATRESRERAVKFVDSDPKDPKLLVRAVGGRDCLISTEKNKKALHLVFSFGNRTLKTVGNENTILSVNKKSIRRVEQISKSESQIITELFPIIKFKNINHLDLEINTREIWNHLFSTPAGKFTNLKKEFLCCFGSYFILIISITAKIEVFANP